MTDRTNEGPQEAIEGAITVRIAPNGVNLFLQIMANYVQGAWNTDMDAAPRDGTVIDAVGRWAGILDHGHPQYVEWKFKAWRRFPADLTSPRLICWAWRPRTEWPEEPK